MRRPSSAGDPRARCAPEAERRRPGQASCAGLAGLLAVVAGAACATVVTPPPPATAPLPLDVDATLLPDDAGRVGGVALRYCLPSTSSTSSTASASVASVASGIAGRWPRRLVPENRRGLGFLVSATDDQGRALTVDAEGVRTRDVVGCVRLVVDIGRMADALADKDLAMRAGDDLVVTPDLWLWRAGPEDDRPRAGAELLLHLDAAPFQAVLPWTRRERQRLAVAPSTWALKSDAAFGRFDVEELEAGGARFVVARLDDGRAPAALSAWIAASVEAVALVNGRYPLESVNVLVVPTHVTRPVVVGFFSRGGGATATFFVGEGGPDIADDDLDATGRWAITHELAHALLPPVRPRDAWFNEGLTTWHQDLLARRAGMLADDESYWRELVRGLETGRARAHSDQLSLEAASTRMHETAAYQHAYWGGVAVMLLAEVEARGQGASLEDLVVALRARFADDRPRSAVELLQALEAEVAPGPAAIAARAIRQTWERHKAAPFPDVAPALALLGVRLDDRGAVHLDDTAPLAAVRKAIPAPRVPKALTTTVAPRS